MADRDFQVLFRFGQFFDRIWLTPFVGQKLLVLLVTFLGVLFAEIEHLAMD